MLLKDKVAVVSGASRGIGKSIAITLAENGADVIIIGTKANLLEEVSNQIVELGRECQVYIGDVSDVKTSKEVVIKVMENFGRIDILVNNAGINMRSSTLDMDVSDWKKIMDINLNGNLYFTQSVLPVMVNQKSGKIVNVSSSTAKSGHKNASPAYGASKAGVDYLTRHLALEMSKYNIYVNGVSPGPIETDMVKQWSSDYREKVLKNIPLQKLGSPRNVADAVLFLSSSMSDFITGETININGGTYIN